MVVTMKYGLALSYITKHALMIQPGNHVPWCLKGVENIGPNKILHIDIYSSLIHKLPELEPTKMSFSR